MRVLPCSGEKVDCGDLGRDLHGRPDGVDLSIMILVIGSVGPQLLAGAISTETHLEPLAVAFNKRQADLHARYIFAAARQGRRRSQSGFCPRPFPCNANNHHPLGRKKCDLQLVQQVKRGPANYTRKMSTLVSRHFLSARSFTPISCQLPGFW